MSCTRFLDLGPRSFLVMGSKEPQLWPPRVHFRASPRAGCCSVIFLLPVSLPVIYLILCTLVMFLSSFFVLLSPPCCLVLLHPLVTCPTCLFTCLLPYPMYSSDDVPPFFLCFHEFLSPCWLYLRYPLVTCVTCPLPYPVYCSIDVPPFPFHYLTFPSLINLLLSLPFLF